MGHSLDTLAADPERPQGRPLGAGSNPDLAKKENLARRHLFALLGSTDEEDPPTGVPIPQVDIFGEKPEHRLMCMLKAQGKNHREIAVAMEYSEGHVQTVLAQPWARKRVMDEIMTSGRDGLDELFKGAAADSVYTLIDVRDDKKESGATRVSAANSLLDRFLGKAVANVNVRSGKLKEFATLEEIDKELEDLKAKEREIMTKLPVREVEAIRTELLNAATAGGAA